MDTLAKIIAEKIRLILTRKNITVAVILTILVLLLVLLLIKYGGFILVFFSFLVLSKIIANYYDFNTILAQAIAAFTVIPLLNLTKLMFSLNKTQRIIGQIIFFGLLGVNFSVIYCNSQGYTLSSGNIAATVVFIFIALALASVTWLASGMGGKKK